MPYVVTVFEGRSAGGRLPPSTMQRKIDELQALEDSRAEAEASW